MRNYYDILGVTKSATEDDIKTAYKKLAIKYHPDKNPDTIDQFKEIAEAYQTLSNPVKKRKYDIGNSFGSDYDRWSSAFGKSDTAKNFHEDTGRPVPPRGADIDIFLDITLEESVLGTEKNIQVDRKRRCAMCDGTGASTQKQCHICNGKGVIRKVETVSFVPEKSIKIRSCTRCKGSGLLIDAPCGYCHGETLTLESKKFTVTIPKGTKDGNYIKVEQFGHAGKNGGPYGAVIVHIAIDQSGQFKRDGDHIVTDVIVTPSDLVLGKKLEVNLFNESIEVNILPGHNSVKPLIVKGKGINDGDFYINLIITTPINPTDEEIECYKKLRDLDWNVGNW